MLVQPHIKFICGGFSVFSAWLDLLPTFLINKNKIDEFFSSLLGETGENSKLITINFQNVWVKVHETVLDVHTLRLETSSLPLYYLLYTDKRLSNIVLLLTAH